MSGCKEKVHNDFGASSHYCLRQAIEGSDYCRQHHDKRNPKEFTPRQHQAKPENDHTRVTVTSMLRWDPMDAPVIKGAYSAKPTIVTHLKFTANSDSDKVTIDASGPVQKADGSAGLKHQSVYIVDIDRQFAESTALEILDEINRLRDLLKKVSDDGE